MPSVPDILRARQRRQVRAGEAARKRISRFNRVFLALVGLGIAALSIGLSVLYSSLTTDLPPVGGVAILLDAQDGLLQTPTILLDRTGENLIYTLQNPAAKNAQYLAYSGEADDLIPDYVVDATVAAMDPGFYQSQPYSFADLFAENPTGIAQQLISDLLFWEEPQGLRRSTRERILAIQLVNQYGHAQVMEWYLNSAHYGYLAYGIDAAARVYFGKSAADLVLPEAALLAAVAEAPDLNPIDTPEIAHDRRQNVLAQMLVQNLIDDEEAAAAIATSTKTSLSITRPEEGITTFKNAVLDELQPSLDLDRLARGGFQIITTLDTDLQAQAECAAQVQFSRVTGQTNELQECDAARLLPTLTGQFDGDLSELQAELVIIDPRSGEILTMVGSNAGNQSSPVLPSHPPGSILTPFIYLSAFTRGFGPASLVWDIPTTLPSYYSGSPNLDSSYHGPMRIRTALANDYLTPALQLLDQLGPENVWQTAARVGLPTLAATTGSAARDLPLGGGALPLLEAAHSFGMLGTQGVLIGFSRPDNGGFPGVPGDFAPLFPTAVLRVLDREGRVWVDSGTPQVRPVISAQLAYLLTHILSDEAARWPSLGHPNALEIGRPAAVKTGFTQDQQSVWTLGSTPQVTVGVWMGVDGDDPRLVVSPRVPAGLWHALIQYATRNLPTESWSPPSGITNLEVCDPSGMLPTLECPTVVTEVFMPGTEPVQADNLYRTVEINRETGLLATVFTPPGLIEERIYFIPPADASSWAQQAGFPIPPENYDLVSQPPVSPEGVRIVEPEMFANVKGMVSLEGTASGDGFVSYSVQVGQGLNPQQWIQITDQETAPVENGELAVWDANGLSGLYAIRLQVVREDQRLETAILQVTVDNLPPVVEIRYPLSDQQFVYPQDDSVTLQFFAADNVLLKSIEIFIDNKLVSTLTQEPYVLSWDLIPGTHPIRVEATDLAGNKSQASITIQVVR